MRVFYCIALSLFSTFSFAETFQKSKRLKIYFSAWSQGYEKEESYDHIGQGYTIDLRNFDFICPGDSFLVGLQTKYEENARRFRFACAFFEDSKGELVKKDLQQCDLEGWDNSLNLAGSSSCSSNILGGLKGKFTAATETGTQGDQQFKSICCTPKSPDGQTLTVDSCGSSKTLNDAFKNPALQICPEDSIIQELKSRFTVSGLNSDRIFTYRCCKLKNS